MTPDKTDDDKKGLDVGFIITILNTNKAQASLRDAELDMIGILAISMCIKTYNDTNSNTNSNDTNSNDNDDDMKKVCSLLIMMLKDYHKKFNEKIVRDVLQLLVDIITHTNSNSNNNDDNDDDVAINLNLKFNNNRYHHHHYHYHHYILGLGDALNRYELGEDIKTLCITIMMMIAPLSPSSSSSSSLSSKAAPPALLTKQHSV